MVKILSLFSVYMVAAMIEFIIVENSAYSQTAIPVDKFGIPCVDVKMRGTETHDKTTRYNYEITNICDRSFSVVLHTNAGWEGYAEAPRGSTTRWFCTDGAWVNKDCLGGVTSWRAQ